MSKLFGVGWLVGWLVGCKPPGSTDHQGSTAYALSCARPISPPHVLGIAKSRVSVGSGAPQEGAKNNAGAPVTGRKTAPEIEAKSL